MNTIGAVGALRLVARLHPQFPPFEEQPRVLRARNAALHMALVDTSDLRSAVVQMAKMVENLLAALDVDRDDFWGERATQVVDPMLDEVAKELERVVQAKIAVARARLETLTAGARPFQDRSKASAARSRLPWCEVVSRSGIGSADLIMK